METLEKMSGTELQEWVNSKKIGEPFFVVVKTANCPKCEQLLQKNILKEGWFNLYEFSPKDKEGLKVMQDAKIVSVPSILFKYRDLEKNYKVHTYLLSEQDADKTNYRELQNTLEAFYDKQHEFFGLTEYCVLGKGETDSPEARLFTNIYDPNGIGQENLNILRGGI